MSFRLVDGGGDYSTLELPAATTIRIPPMCMASIPHNIRVLSQDIETVLWIARLPHAWEALNLLVDQGPLSLSDRLCTHVFNLSNRQVKIPRGAVVSQLISLRLG